MSRNRCVCTHGWGQHQVPSKPLRAMPDGSIRVWSTVEWDLPLVCCDRDCDCEQFVERRARWRRKPGGRKDCWIGDDGFPVCGKKFGPFSEEKMNRGHESRDKCAGCRRWLADNPEAVLP